MNISLEYQKSPKYRLYYHLVFKEIIHILYELTVSLFYKTLRNSSYLISLKCHTLFKSFFFTYRNDPNSKVEWYMKKFSLKIYMIRRFLFNYDTEIPHKQAK